MDRERISLPDGASLSDIKDRDPALHGSLLAFCDRLDPSSFPEATLIRESGNLEALARIYERMKSSGKERQAEEAGDLILSIGSFYRDRDGEPHAEGRKRPVSKEFGSDRHGGPETLAAKKEKREYALHSFDNEAIERGDLAETARFRKAVDFLLSYFPASEQVPAEVFLDTAARSARRELGTNERNSYQLSVVEHDGKVIGAASSIYLADVSSLFVGFVRVSEEFQNTTVAPMLMRSAFRFGKESAQAAGKELATISGEVEYISESTNKADAEKRLRVFEDIGTRMADPASGFRYFQPGPDGERIPLTLVFRDVKGREHMGRDELADTVRAIYSVIYAQVPQEITRKAMDDIIATIPADGVRLVWNMVKSAGG